MFCYYYDFFSLLLQTKKPHTHTQTTHEHMRTTACRARQLHGISYYASGSVNRKIKIKPRTLRTERLCAMCVAIRTNGVYRTPSIIWYRLTANLLNCAEWEWGGYPIAYYCIIMPQIPYSYLILTFSRINSVNVNNWGWGESYASTNNRKNRTNHLPEWAKSMIGIWPFAKSVSTSSCNLFVSIFAIPKLFFSCIR